MQSATIYELKSDAIECGFSQVERGMPTSPGVIISSRVQHQTRKVELVLSTINKYWVTNTRVW